jgi:hypothetical protein
MVKAVGGEFVEAVAIDPALAVAVPAPESPGVTIGTMASTAFIWFLAPVVARAELLAVGIGPSG